MNCKELYKKLSLKSIYGENLFMNNYRISSVYRGDYIYFRLILTIYLKGIIDWIILSEIFTFIMRQITENVGKIKSYD